MFIIRILGAIDLLSASLFLMLIFGLTPIFQLTLFCAALLMLKGMFILSGEPLSLIDLCSSLLLILSIFFSLPILLYWIFSFLLLAKGIVSLI